VAIANIAVATSRATSELRARPRPSLRSLGDLIGLSFRSLEAGPAVDHARFLHLAVLKVVVEIDLIPTVL
jgi:hypothetical protein